MRGILAVLISAALAAGLPSVAEACSCAPPQGTARDSLAARDAVFSGRVVGLRLPRRGPDGHREEGTLIASFEVERSWKGRFGQGVEVRTAISSAACGFPFRLGQRYLVFASGHPKLLGTNLCARTAALVESEQALRELGEPERRFGPDGSLQPEPEWECRDTSLRGVAGRVCFPVGHVCRDPHGIGDGVPVAVDCFTGGSRGCNPHREAWPACAGGRFTASTESP